jgi:hypothetical protein
LLKLLLAAIGGGVVKSSAAQRALALFAAFALVAATCLGGARSFLCLCAGAPVQTAADHCHGPEHGPECLDKHQHDGCAEEGSHGSDERKHLAVSNEAPSSLPGKSFSMPEHVGLLLAVLPSSELIENAPRRYIAATGVSRALGPPRLSWRLARSVSLQI